MTDPDIVFVLGAVTVQHVGDGFVGIGVAVEPGDDFDLWLVVPAGLAKRLVAELPAALSAATGDELGQPYGRPIPHRREP